MLLVVYVKSQLKRTRNTECYSVLLNIMIAFKKNAINWKWPRRHPPPPLQGWSGDARGSRDIIVRGGGGRAQIGIRSAFNDVPGITRVSGPWSGHARDSRDIIVRGKGDDKLGLE